MAAEDHSIVGASSAKRWMNCPGSLVLCRDASNVPTEFSRLGHAAHELAEICLRTGSDARGHLGEYIDADGQGVPVDMDMIESVQMYLDEVRSLITPKSLVGIEKKFNLNWLHDSFGPKFSLFGTGDFVVGEPGGTLYIYDYKHGAGVSVDICTTAEAYAEEHGRPLDKVVKFAGRTPWLLVNPQLLYYALGCLGQHNKHKFKEVCIGIVQPRARHADGPIRTYTLTVDEVYEWGAQELVPRALTALNALSGGHAAQQFKSGSWCQFCMGIARCPVMAQEAQALAKMDFGAGEGQDPTFPPVQSVNPADIVRLHLAAPRIKAYLKEVAAFVQNRLEAGDVNYQGLGVKLVRTRGSYAWTDEGVVFRQFKHLGGDVYIRSLRSPNQMKNLLQEKGVSKEEREALVSGLTTYSEGGITVAPMSDRRKAVLPTAVTDFQTVGGSALDFLGSARTPEKSCGLDFLNARKCKTNKS